MKSLKLIQLVEYVGSWLSILSTSKSILVIDPLIVDERFVPHQFLFYFEATVVISLLSIFFLPLFVIFGLCWGGGIINNL